MMEWRAGRVSESLRRAKEAVRYSDKGGDAEQRVSYRINCAYALLLVGKSSLAKKMLQQAADIFDSEASPISLDWLTHFRAFEVLLVDAERVSWLTFMGVKITNSLLKSAQDAIERAELRIKKLKITPRQISRMGMLDCACYNLILGRLTLYRSLCFERSDVQKTKKKARGYIGTALLKLKGNDSGAVPIGAVSLAWACELVGESDTGQDALDEALSVATRGALIGHNIDILLYRIRLFFRKDNYPWENGPRHDLAEVSRLIDKSGYFRRRNELKDLEKCILYE